MCDTKPLFGSSASWRRGRASKLNYSWWVLVVFSQLGCHLPPGWQSYCAWWKFGTSEGAIKKLQFWMFLAMNGLERVGSLWRPRETSPLPPSLDNFHQDALLMPAACSAAWGRQTASWKIVIQFLLRWKQDVEQSAKRYKSVSRMVIIDNYRWRFLHNFQVSNPFLSFWGVAIARTWLKHLETCWNHQPLKTWGSYLKKMLGRYACQIYPLVNIQKTIENGHRNRWNSGFSHEKWWIFPLLC